jgi:hypothetical protein
VLLPVFTAVVGALVMGSTKPRTACEKMRALGSRSGLTYDIEEFPSAGFVVVRAPDGSEGVLTRRMPGDPRGNGFDWSRGRGNPGTLKVLRADFGAAGARPPTPSAPLPTPKERAP